ncbi:cbb3-type cytochrome c oxidase subunit 3 [Hyphomicrobium sp. D-2]|uniref:cbb3-type cytochrome oxidase subunit 3 n=1 Tax=Hyphomicrobium sp. D-2 TaxID=3041621 RepID=UPI0024549951|nr:cbb3-type cytochrome c oxidase subunit 3 [Hyphomicrobium sp. D-2]MDH4981995.1 cbb3-type cytochrome c oxidase subunit 3 [Hyphomicrobium sp. D-2]
MDYQSATVISQIIALVLFVGLFATIIVYVFWPGNKKKFDEAAQVPLDDKDDEPEGKA